jgi:CubicO group peptidase (beta-lactamase class C family)
MNDMHVAAASSTTNGTAFPLVTGGLAELGLHAPAIERLRGLIRAHIAQGRYPGAQIALARHGKLALFESFGNASITPARPASENTLWLLFSNTKVITAAGIWALVEEGRVRFSDTVAEYIPEYARHGKGDITIAQVMSHRAGYPSQGCSAECWTDHALMRKQVCDFTLEWTPGTRLHYHGRAAHWTLAAVIEAVSGEDYRDFLRSRILEPLGLARDIFVGLPDAEHGRVATIYEPLADGSQRPLAEENSAAHKRAGIPSSGGFATARGMAALYQMMANFGKLNGVRLFSRRLIEFATRNHTDEMFDGGMSMPMHRGLGVHVRGTTETIRGLGTLASPNTFGHGGVGTSYCWADPDSGVSFAYLTNSRIPDPWHSRRLDLIANFVHSAID